MKRRYLWSSGWCILLGIVLSGCLGSGSSSSPTTGTKPTYTLSGAATVGGAGLPGVTVTLSGAASATATTDANGKYSFTGLVNGDYTVTPTLAGYTFDPSSSSKTVNGSDQSNVSFAAAIGASLVGNWISLDNGFVSIVNFFDNANFMYAQYFPANVTGTPGIEYGTYSYTVSAFTPTIIADTNGTWGMSGLAGGSAGYTISGDALTISGAGLASSWMKILPSSSNPLVGCWLYTPHGYNVVGVLTFIDDTTFLYSYYDPNSIGYTGLEYGTYTSTAGTFTVTILDDTNNVAGMSNFPGGVVTYSISGNALTLEGVSSPLTKIP